MYRTLATKAKIDVVREYQPIRRTITSLTYDAWDEVGYGKEKTYSLQFPTMLFMWSGGQLFVGFAKGPIKSLDDTVYCATIGNVYEDWHVCGCNSGEHGEYSGCLKASIEKFWSSIFTDDGDAGPDGLCDTFGTYGNWSRLKSVKGVVKKISKNCGRYGRLTFAQFLERGDYYDTYSEKLLTEQLELNLKATYPTETLFPRKKKKNARTTRRSSHVVKRKKSIRSRAAVK